MSMTSSITIENEHFSAKIFPGYGGKVASLVDKYDGYDLLFSYPTEYPMQPHYDIEYGNGWYAGWDECFPGIAPGEYPLHPYRGVSVPDHGELWGLPTQIKPSAGGLLVRWHGLRFGYHLSRQISLRGDTLISEYELENLAPFDFQFVWAMHSLMRLSGPVELCQQDQGTWRVSHDARGATINRDFHWPNIDVDLSRPDVLPEGKGWKVFSNQPITSPFIVRYPERRRQLSISYESSFDIAAYWGIWINTGGWAGHRHFAIEPTTGRFDHVASAIDDQSAACVGPLKTVGWKVCWKLG